MKIATSLYVGIALVSLSIFLFASAPVFAQQLNGELYIREQSEQIFTSVRAWVSNKHPKQYTRVKASCEAKDQNNKPIADVQCTFEWKYASITHTQIALTAENGKATVSRKIGRATKGKKVEITVIAVYKDIIKTTATNFTPR